MTNILMNILSKSNTLQELHRFFIKIIKHYYLMTTIRRSDSTKKNPANQKYPNQIIGSAICGRYIDVHHQLVLYVLKLFQCLTCIKEN